MSIDAATMERLVPDRLTGGTTGEETLRLHLERYEFAARHIGQRKMILDIACGVGYGSRLLLDAIPGSEIVGVDLSGDAINYARGRYAAPGLTFISADAMSFTAPPSNAVVSLETIEHLPEPERFVQRVAASLLEPGGVFIGSVPVTPSVDANPHHLSDFTEASFRRLLKSAGLIETDSLLQVQPFNPFAVATRSEDRMENMRRNLIGYYLSHPTKALLRIKSTLVEGFNNKYLTIAAEKL